MTRLFACAIFASCLALTIGCSNTGVTSKTPAAAAPATAPAEKFVNVDPSKFEELSKQPNTVILDVRTSDEYAAGHIAGSTLIDVRSPDFVQRISSLDKSKTYLVHCRSGTRSVSACNLLSEQGFNKLYNLSGGINAWQSSGKPVQK